MGIVNDSAKQSRKDCGIRGSQEAHDTVFKKVPETTDSRRDNGKAVGHCLENRNRKTFGLRGEQVGLGATKGPKFLRALHVAQE